MTDDVPSHDTLEGFPLSPQQRRAWTLYDDAEDPGVEIRLRVEGATDAAIREAVAALVGRFEILRTTFRRLPGMPQPLQVIHDDAPLTWEVHDLRGDASPDDLFEAVRQPVEDVGLRVGLGEVDEEAFVVAFHLSSLQADAATAQALAGALRDEIRGTEPDEEPLQYADLADWLNETLEGEGSADGRAFWRNQLPEGFDEAWLPVSSPPESTSFEAQPAGPKEVLVPLDDGLAAEIRQLASRLSASPRAVVLAAWQGLLGRLVEADAVVVGVAFEGRGYEELADAVGPLTRFAPIAAPSIDVPFSDRVRVAQAALDEGASWQDTFDWKAIGDDESAGTPFAFYWTERPSVADDGISVTVEHVEVPLGASRVRLAVVASDLGLSARLTFAPDALAPDAAERLAGQLALLLTAATREPEAPLRRHSILTDADRAALDAFAVSAEPVEPEHATLHALVEAQVETAPEATAVVGSDGTLTYAELNARANRLARHLRNLGVEAESRVAILLDRSIDAVVAVLATLKAGGAYVPLDPAYPAERIAFMLDDADARVLITQASFGEGLPESNVATVTLDRDSGAIAACSPDPLGDSAEAEDAAYVIYTSGSTGRPKGVVVEHRQAVHSTAARRAVYPGSVGAYLLLPSLAFDSSVAGLFWTLSTGGTLVVPSSDEAADPRALARLVATHGVTHLLGVPSLYNLLLDADSDRLASLRTCIVAGEACPPGLVERHAQRLPEAKLYNEYGPTEATVWSTVYDIADWKHDRAASPTVPIGRPIPGARVLLLDDAGRRVPPGATGELCIGGPGVARGYLGRADLTAERFVEGPDGERLYRTGDLGRFLPDGTLVFLGRADGQVKLRGYRIELGEIEAVLSEHAGVAEAAVALRDDATGEARLVAYVVPDAASAGPVRRSLEVDAEEPLYTLPNGLRVAHQNPAETDYIYGEIFEEQSYFRNGISLETGACVFDVGANIGMFSLLVSLSVPDARVFAFEPIPETAEMLRTNAALYGGDVRVFACALSREAGKAEFSYFPHVSLVSGRYADGVDERDAIKAFLRHSAPSAGAAHSGDGAPPTDAHLDSLLDSRLERHAVQVPMRTVSDVIRTEGVERIDLLKIDVEKSELDVLEGIADADWPKIRQVSMEVQDTDGALDRTREILMAKGFQVATEQEEALGSTPLVKVYAIRNDDVRRDDASDQRYTPKIPRWTDPVALEADLRDHAARRLPAYMVPDAVLLLDDLPRTPNGKLDRDALPAPPTPEAASDAVFAAPTTDTEARLTAVWAAVLGIDRVGIHDDFFELGGHSLLAIKLFAQIEKEFGAAPALASLFSAPTIARLAPVVERAVGTETDDEQNATPALVPLQPNGDRPPLFCFHNAHNQVLLYSALAEAIGHDQPLYHVQGQGHDGLEIAHTSLQGMAREYLDQIRTLQPEGPYMLAGYCIGGRLAMEVGRLLLADDEEVGLLAIIEAPEAPPLPSRREKYRIILTGLVETDGAASFDPRALGRWAASRFTHRMRRWFDRFSPDVARLYLKRGERIPAPLRVPHILDTYYHIMYAEELAPYPGDVVLIRSAQSDDLNADWRGLTQGRFEEEVVDGYRLLKEPRVGEVAARLRQRMESAVGAP